MGNECRAMSPSRSPTSDSLLGTHCSLLPFPMLDNLRNLAGLPGMLAKAGEMKARMADMQGRLDTQLKALRAEGDAGGGLVTAVCNGKLELVSVKFASDKVGGGSAEDVELLEDLVVAAVAAAQAKARDQAAELAQKEMAKVAEEVGLPANLMDQLKAGGLG